MSMLPSRLMLQHFTTQQFPAYPTNTYSPYPDLTYPTNPTNTRNNGFNPQNRKLNILISNSSQQVDDFVRDNKIYQRTLSVRQACLDVECRRLITRPLRANAPVRDRDVIAGKNVDRGGRPEEDGWTHRGPPNGVVFRALLLRALCGAKSVSFSQN